MAIDGAAADEGALLLAYRSSSSLQMSCAIRGMLQRSPPVIAV
jgi:hypothetical protein